MNENLRNNKEAGSPEQQKYKRDDAQLSAPAIDLGQYASNSYNQCQ